MDRREGLVLLEAEAEAIRGGCGLRRRTRRARGFRDVSCDIS